MNLDELRIGDDFYLDTKDGDVLYRCTDIGTRTIVAIEVHKDDPSWNNGPPYACVEIVFDEDDMQVCRLKIPDEWIRAAVRLQRAAIRREAAVLAKCTKF